MKKDADIEIMRRLAGQYREVCSNPREDMKRDLWRKHNSLRKTRPLVKILGGLAFRKEIVPDDALLCKDSFFKGHERWLRHEIFRASTEDDTVFEPWITQQAVHIVPPGEDWGIFDKKEIYEESGAWVSEPLLKDLDKLDQLKIPSYSIDEPATMVNADRLSSALDGILEVNIDRSPPLKNFGGDISYWLGQIRGIEQILWDVIDQPDLFHKLCAFLRDGILKQQEEGERAGAWKLSNHQTQSVPYALDLKDPVANGAPVNRKQLWSFMAAQEFEQISPEMHEEFLLRYQMPIAEKFGLVAYGCCENLTNKIDILRKMPNLRRIAVT
ncbi:MAG: hypothetical protein WAX69_26345, partial [Victivallales bacterium]